MMTVDPTLYNLHPKVRLKKTEKDIFIVIDRKSRIVMKDGRRIFEIATKIKQIETGIKISVLSNAPICSKTQKFLFQNDITIKGL